MCSGRTPMPMGRAGMRRPHGTRFRSRTTKAGRTGVWLASTRLMTRGWRQRPEQPELVHDLERRGVNRVATKVAQEVRVLFEHDDTDPGPGQEQAEHHSRRAASDDAARHRPGAIIWPQGGLLDAHL